MIIEALNIGDINKIKYLITDCDGVLTDGKYYYDKNGKQLITFSSKDSIAINLAKKTDLKIILISSTSSPGLIQKRALEWGVDFYSVKSFYKIEKIQEIVSDLSEVAYIGDSLDDINVFNKVAISFSPSDAVKEIKKYVKCILNSKGGEGCLLESFLSLRFVNENWTEFKPN